MCDADDAYAAAAASQPSSHPALHSASPLFKYAPHVQLLL
jgi:hypothetical protein